MPTPRKRRPTGVRPIYDKNGVLISYQARLPRPGPDGKSTKNHPTEGAAIEWRADTLHAMRHPGDYAPVAPEMTLAEYARHYLSVKARRKRPTTAEGDADIVQLNIIDHPIGALRLDQVKPTHVEKWVGELITVRHLSPRTLRNRIGKLRAIFAMAIDNDVLRGRNPVRSLDTLGVPAIETVEVPVLTGAQVFQLGGAMPPRHRALVIFSGATGLRGSEALGLRTGDLRDWLSDHPWVRIETQLNEGARRDVKTDESHRSIPIDPDMRDLLQAHMDVWPPLAEHDGLIFYTKHCGANRPYSLGTYEDRLRFAAGRLHAADPTFPEFPRGRTTHLLRHYFGSHMMVLTGGDRALVQRLMGHKPGSPVTDGYVHPTPDSDRRAREALAKLYTLNSDGVRRTMRAVD